MWVMPSRQEIAAIAPRIARTVRGAMKVRPPTPNGLKPKDLIGVPWRLAFALQEAGWWLRLGSGLVQTERASRIRPGPAHESSRNCFPALQVPGLLL